MEIVFLDALTLGEEISLERFKRFGKVYIHQTCKPDELPNKIENADILVTNKVVLGEDEFKIAKNLKLICVAATGFNNVDLNGAAKRGIVVANVRNYSTEGVAQHTFSLILAIENSLIDYINDTRNGLWSASPVFTMIKYPLNELRDRKIGIIGYGNIGKRVAEIAKVFGMQVLIGKRKGIEYSDYERVDFEFLLRESDILTIHAPLSENTKDLITLNELKMMKPGAVLINVARGGIVNENDLYTALSQNIIRAAALDVVDKEPISINNKLCQLRNLLISPHIAWASYQSRLRLLDGIEQNIEKFIQNKSDEINLAL